MPGACVPSVVTADEIVIPNKEMIDTVLCTNEDHTLVCPPIIWKGLHRFIYTVTS